ncbi:MAG: hypothetical protein ACRDN9_04985 [Streptosporangiaceae bacterium]
MTRVSPSMWPPVILASSALALAVDLAAAPTPLRMAAVFWFVGVCPGMALVRLLGLTDPVARLTLAVATSLSIAALAAEGMALAHLWSSTGLLAGLAGLSVAALAVSAHRRDGSPTQPPAQAPSQSLPPSRALSAHHRPREETSP